MRQSDHWQADRSIGRRDRPIRENEVLVRLLGRRKAADADESGDETGEVGTIAGFVAGLAPSGREIGRIST